VSRCVLGILSGLVLYGLGLADVRAQILGVGALESEVAGAFHLPLPSPDSLPRSEGPVRVLLADLLPLFADGFEGPFPGTVWECAGTPTWGSTTFDRVGGSHSVWCAGSSMNPKSGYPNNQSAAMVWGPFSLADAGDAYLDFWLKNDSEPGYDYVYWMVAANGSPFRGYKFSGTTKGWAPVRLDLKDVPELGNLCGQAEVYVGFVFISDEIVGGPTYKGAFLDDVVVSIDTNPRQDRIWYVRSGAEGMKNGISWADAFCDLQDGLRAADAGDQVWVGRGLYRPATTAGDRSATFRLKRGVSLYGGFAGTETSLASRQSGPEDCVLSGDLNADDGAGGANTGENSYHVVMARSTDAATVFDGFTVIGGNALDLTNGKNGAGLLLESGSLRVSNCVFRDNRAEYGAAITSFYGMSLTTEDCVFEANVGGAVAAMMTDNSVIRRSTFTRNSGGYGSAIENFSGKLQLHSCLVSDNTSQQNGALYLVGDCDISESRFETNRGEMGPAAVYCDGLPDTIVSFSNCSFIANEGNGVGGAAFINSPARFVNCRFGGNAAVSGGVAAVANAGTSLQLIQCSATGNRASHGGALSIALGASAHLQNCTMSGNESAEGGAVFVGEKASLTMVNSILWGNTPRNLEQESATTVIRVDASDLPGDWPGEGNIDASPRFVDLDGMDNRIGTEDDDIRVLPGSPCLDSGANSLLSADVADLDGDGDRAEPLPLDLRGEARLRDEPTSPDTGTGTPPLVDMGAVEGPGPACSLVVSPQQVVVPEGGTASIWVSLGVEPAASIPATIVRVSGDPDIALRSSSTLIFERSGGLHPWDVAQEVILSASSDPDGLVGLARFKVTLGDCASSEFTAAEKDDEPFSEVVYVDQSVPEGGNGTSWSSAFTSLQFALQAAALGGYPLEIRVAAGVYVPDPIGRDRLISFVLPDNVALLGGYAGARSSAPDDRDPDRYVTVLSGDLLGNDDETALSSLDNSYHVVVTKSTGPRTKLDGFMIRGGNADGPPPYDNGGAVFCNGGSPVISRCRFTGNCSKTYAGAVYNTGYGNPVVSDSRFEENRADSSGGAVANSGGSHAQFMNCTFSRNTGHWDSGAARDLDGANSSYLNCLFEYNIVEEPIYGNAGAVGLTDSNSGFGNCLFSGNACPGFGGGLGVFNSQLTLVNCTLVQNAATREGGAIYGYESSVTIINSIVWHNTSGAQILLENTSSLSTSYSDIEGGQSGVLVDPGDVLEWGNGMICSDPLLTQEDHLSAGSPCIDAGTNAVLSREGQLGVSARCEIDLEKNLRRFDDPLTSDTGQAGEHPPVIDMGALEYGSLAMPSIIRVSTEAAGAGWGLDWPNAMTDLQVALATARAAGGRVQQIWMAAGNYHPDPPSGDRKSTFQLVTGTAVYGGFAGTETELSQRDPDAHETILSGDLNGNDTADPATWMDNVYHVVTASYTNATAVLDGFTISGGNADGTGADALGSGIYLSAGKPTLRNIRLAGNDGGEVVYSDFGQPQLGTMVIDTGTAAGMTAGILSRNQAWLEGELSLMGGTPASPSALQLKATHFDGPGGIRLSSCSLLEVLDSPFYDPTIIRTNVTGPGVIHIAPGQQLNLEGSARVNLERQPNDQCSDPIGTGGGRIIVDGTLIARDQATIENTNICVNQADVQGTSRIQNNNIRLLETTTGFGGQFYVEDTASIIDNHIVSEGDRYLDLDPNPDPNTPHPDIRDNLIEVIIKSGTPVEQGTLLELRSPDEDCADPDHCAAGAFPGGNGYHDKWVLQKLELEPSAKLNLTNRQGFDFNPGLTIPDTVYVRQLILNPGSVLNVAGQRLYYQELIGDPTQIVDQPLLGFSLGIIGMNDDTEFDVRLTTRLTDEADRDPEHPADPLPEGVVERITLGSDDTPPNEGVMRMQTHKPNEAKSASSVAAKGHFTRAAEDLIDIVFQYRFCSADGELIVKISGNRETGQGNVEVARIQPVPGTAGSMGNAFAIFQQSVPRGDLNFLRGTFVELELRGQDACVLIDNFDPRIECNTAGKCGDLNNNWGIVNAEDYLLLLASYGSVVRADDPTVAQPTYRFWCLDINGDKYVDSNDLMAWETAWRTRLNLCGEGVLASAGMKSQARSEAGSSTTSILLAGKQKASSQNDSLYRLAGEALTVNSEGKTLVAAGICPVEPIAPAGGQNTRANGRLISGSDGEIYQINGADGLYRIQLDGSHRCVLRPGSAPGPANDQIVYIGTNNVNNAAVGLPIADAVIRQEGTNTCAYVVPAVVQTTSNGITYCYRAAAKVRLNADASFSVVNLYGEDPGPPTSTWSPVDRGRPREIELDDMGTTLYVVSAQAFNGNDYVLVYNANDTNPAPERVISLYGLFGQESDVPRGATAMLLSGSDLYLAAAVNPLAQTHTRIYRFQTTESCATGLCSAGRVDIRNPTVPNTYNTNPMIGFVTALAKSPDGNLYMAGVVSPTFSESETPPGGDLFTTPTVAMVKPEWFGSAPANLEAAALTCGDLALPAGLAFGAPLASGPAADFDGDGDVDGDDYSRFASCVTGPAIRYADHPTPGCALSADGQGLLPADLDRDGDVDQRDFGVFQRCYSGAGEQADPDCADSSS